MNTWWYLAESAAWTLLWILVGTVIGWALDDTERGRLW